MNKKALLKKVVKKLAKKGPTLGSFYLIGDAVYYSTINSCLDHMDLWKKVVNHAFKTLSYETKVELQDAFYGANRGRVTWTGEMIEGEPHGPGNYILYGTPGCAKHEAALKGLFGLKGLPSTRLKVDWVTDEHYKTMKQDVAVVEDAVKWLDPKDKLQTTHVASKLRFILMD